MKQCLSLVTTVFFLFGCATPLHVRVDSQISKGDSQEKVRELIGDPDSFAPSRTVSGGTDWTYQSNGSICQLSFDEGGAVSQIACDGSNYVSPGRKFLRGFGKGMSESMKNMNSNKNQYHCRPDQLGGYYCN